MEKNYEQLGDILNDYNIVIKNGMLFAKPKPSKVLDMSRLKTLEYKDFYVLCCIATDAGYTHLEIQDKVIPHKAKQTIEECINLGILKSPSFQGIELIILEDK